MLKNRSFVVKMVKDGDVSEEESAAPIDLDQVLSSVVTAGAILIGTYMAADVVRQLLVNKCSPAVINTVAPVFNNNNSSNVLLNGYLHKIVRNNNTGEIFESVKAAAEHAKVVPAVMSKHLHGYEGFEDIGQEVYSIIGIGA